MDLSNWSLSLIILLVVLFIQLLNSRAGFVETPSPSLMIVTMEEQYTYLCNNSATDRIIWRVNGSVLWTEIFPQSFNVSIVDFPDSGRLYTLTIGGHPEHNTTTIQCVASFSDGSYPEVTPVALFLIQGTLNRVSSFNRSSESLLWTAPFSLNLTNAEPDIVYCVEVYNITCGRGLLISECDVIETSYTHDALLPGYIYEYTVTPRSNVEGARNGTSLTVTERFSTLKNNSKVGYTICVINSNVTLPLKSSEVGNVKVMAKLHLQIYSVGSVETIRPLFYSISFNSLDGLTADDGLTVTVPAATIENEGFVLLELAPLPLRRLWNVNVFAYHCENHPLVEQTELGTHDIYNISITSPDHDALIVTGDIMDESSSIGALIIVYSLNNYTNIFYKFAPHTPVQEVIDFMITGLPNDQYEVSVFFLEKSGLPFNKIASQVKYAQINRTGTVEVVQSYAVEYFITSTLTGICITCTFLDNSTTDCVAVVHQRISWLSFSGLMYIKSSHKFNRSFDTAYGCIEEVDLERYQIGVIGGNNIMKSMTVINDIVLHVCVPTSIIITVFESESHNLLPVCIGCSVGGAIGLFLIASVVLGLFIMFILKWKSKRQKLLTLDHPQMNNEGIANEDVMGMHMHKCDAYEMTWISKQKVVMKDNPAYGDVGVCIIRH